MKQGSTPIPPPAAIRACWALMLVDRLRLRDFRGIDVDACGWSVLLRVRKNADGQCRRERQKQFHRCAIGHADCHRPGHRGGRASLRAPL